ncbi:ABC transporter ATP-binding protein [Fontibacillus sp. BL9]|uniref:ABC transporter ATP-binding protein n=1 Tax=Fontibacillus sp. BL9 TaxID=3389971 RepID=UPI0039793646
MTAKTNTGGNPPLTVWTAFRRLVSYAGVYRAGFLAAVLLLGAKMVIDIGFATVQKLFIDTITNSDMDGLRRITVLCGIACVIILVCLMFQHYFRFVVQFRMTWDLRSRLFDKSNRLSFQEIQSMHSGDLSSRNNKDANSAMSMVSNIVYELLYNLLLTLVSFIYLARSDVWIALLALGSGPVVFFCSRFFDRKLRRLSVEIFAREAGLRSLLQEVVQGMTVVRAFGMEDALLKRFVDERAQLGILQRKRTVLIGLLWQTSGFVNNAVMIMCSGLIAYSAMGGGMTAGGVLAFVILIGRVQWPFVHMSQTWGSVQEALGASDRIFEILDKKTEDDVDEEKGGSRTESPVSVTNTELAAKTSEESKPEPMVSKGFEVNGEQPAICLREVHYAHASSAETGNPSLFSGLNLQIQAGETVAVVGPSGSGKSTLVRLCCGLYQPDQGSISLYGFSLQDQLQQGRKLTTYVPQVPYLFAGTIRDNIAFGSEEKSEEEIMAAARLAGADDFITKLPEGYGTQIGEHGASLSGGQKQRIAIARAFLREAPLLLLDEATSALDNETESLVLRSLDLLMQNRTTLVIAHRLSTILNADRILVMEKGRIVEEGTHESLLAHQGLYAKLYRIQFQESEEAAPAV